MNQAIEKLLNVLTELKDKNITDVKYENDRFSFKFCGGKFFFIKSVSADLKTGYLSLFHETTLVGVKSIIEIKDFEIKVIERFGGFYLKIKNYLDFSRGIYQREETDGYIDTDYDDLLAYFPKQLRSKLLKDDFRIYIG